MKQVKPTQATANLVKEANVNSVTLIGTDGVEFEARFAPVTASRMESLLRASSKYTDADELVEQTLSAIKLMPELKEEVPGYDKIKDFIEGLTDEDVEKKKIIGRILLKGGLTSEQIANNLSTLRNYVRIMILETTLDATQLDWIKSELDSEFWDLQDLNTIRNTGEFFRKKVAEYSK